MACGLLLILAVPAFAFVLTSNFRLGLNVVVVNNTEKYISRLVFGNTAYPPDNLAIYSLEPGSASSGYRRLRLDGIAMFYEDDNLRVRTIPVGYMYGSPNQIYLLIVKINAVNDDGEIVEHEVFNIDTASGFQLAGMFRALSNQSR
jgi:hypothetical protein